MKRYSIKIERDTYPESPREWDNLGTMTCSHRRYNLGDEQLNNVEFWNFINRNGGVDQFLMLPLYLYDHSGITISTTPFSCPWDSGQVGYIYVSKEAVRKEWNVNRISKKLTDKVLESLKCEVREYDKYLRGDVWCYSIEDQNGEEVDSCCGMFGEDYCRETAEQEIVQMEAYDEKKRQQELKTLIRSRVPLSLRAGLLEERV